MERVLRIVRYELQNLMRSRFLIVMAASLFVVTELLFRFGGDAGPTISSLMNIVLMVIPLVAVVVGTIYSYNSREFNELLLAQPLDRTTIYLGKLIGFSGALSAAVIAGIGLPFLIHAGSLGGYVGKLITLIAVACCFVVVFSSLAFWAATRFEDRIKGLGTTLLAWFFLAAVWDGAILLIVHLFRDYPYEPAMIGLIFLNPIDVGRILILMQLDISALMGYTGAIFRKMFGSDAGLTLATAAMIVYALVPAWFGLRMFRRKDF